MKVRDFLRAHEAGSDDIKYIALDYSIYDPYDTNLLIRMYGNKDISSWEVFGDTIRIYINGERLEVEEDYDRMRRYRRR